MEAVLALGSNLGNKKQNLDKAIEAINLICKTEVIAVSKFYSTKPFGVPDVQDDYLNCCVKVNTCLLAHTLLGACLGIEASMGRKREYRFSSRIIDIDLLLYGEEICNTSDLILPHPRIKERAFVMLPLSNLCEDKKFHNFDFSVEFEAIDKSDVLMYY